MMNRKLVRPNLAELKEKFNAPRPPQNAPAISESEREAASSPPTIHAHATPQSHGGPQGQRRRQVPPENTSAEAFYYVKQMNNRTPMVVMLDNGVQLRGHIEWYDRGCIKVNREAAPNLLVYKHAIRYMYKQEEETGGSASPKAPSEN